MQGLILRSKRIFTWLQGSETMWGIDVGACLPGHHKPSRLAHARAEYVLSFPQGPSCSPPATLGTPRRLLEILELQEFGVLGAREV